MRTSKVNKERTVIRMGTRLYVGNLSYDATENDLQALFEEVGSVVNCDIMMDRHTGRAKGFAFVEMASQEDANKAIETCNEKDFQGRALSVNEARPRAERPAQNFGGGFSGGRGGGGGGRGGGAGGGRGGGGGGGFGAAGKRRSGKGSRRGLRNEKRSRKGIF
jgi:RNA recognition motif-containing protein